MTHRAESDSRALPEGTLLQDGNASYRILRVLGSGGFGITYVAQDLLFDRLVAIKEHLPRQWAVRGETRGGSPGPVQPTSAQDEESYHWGLRSFLAEARELARNDHPALLTVQRYFEAWNTAYMVMPLIEGDTLWARIRRARLSYDEARRLLAQMLDGLEALHRRGALHRDIKPGNIILRKEDLSPVLIDFGSARHAISQHSQNLTSLVSAPYSPREQYSETLPQSEASDLYALSGTIYVALFGAKLKGAIERQDDPDLPELDAAVASGAVPEAFASALRKGLAPIARDRHQSVAEFRAALPDSRAPPAGRATGPDRTVKAGPRPERNPAAAARYGANFWKAIFFGALLLIALGLSWVKYDRQIRAAFGHIRTLVESSLRDLVSGDRGHPSSISRLPPPPPPIDPALQQQLQELMQLLGAKDQALAEQTQRLGDSAPATTPAGARYEKAVQEMRRHLSDCRILEGRAREALNRGNGLEAGETLQKAQDCRRRLTDAEAELLSAAEDLLRGGEPPPDIARLLDTASHYELRRQLAADPTRPGAAHLQRELDWLPNGGHPPRYCAIVIYAIADRNRLARLAQNWRAPRSEPSAGVSPGKFRDAPCLAGAGRDQCRPPVSRRAARAR